MGIFSLELEIIKHHHERFDGTGYPVGLKGSEIPFGARILAVADAFDNITSDRAHQQAKSCESALKEISDLSGAQFDPHVVDALHKAVKKHKTEWFFSNQNCVTSSL
jgi:HD-GYP domain-containing protein (c-di-GMP phosphodiesterase class II)